MFLEARGETRNPLELELPEVVTSLRWVLAINVGSSARAALAFNL